MSNLDSISALNFAHLLLHVMKLETSTAVVIFPRLNRHASILGLYWNLENSTFVWHAVIYAEIQYVHMYLCFWSQFSSLTIQLD